VAVPLQYFTPDVPTATLTIYRHLGLAHSMLDL